MPDIFCSTLIDKFYPFVTITDKNIEHISPLYHPYREETYPFWSSCPSKFPFSRWQQGGRFFLGLITHNCNIPDCYEVSREIFLFVEESPRSAFFICRRRNTLSGTWDRLRVSFSVFDVETGWQLSLTAAWLNAVRSSPSEGKREKSDIRHTKRSKRDRKRAFWQTHSNLKTCWDRS